MPFFARRLVTGAKGVVAALAMATASWAAAQELVITDFNAAATGSYNPREDWFGFGNGTTDRGVMSDGSVGHGAYHSVNWDSSDWGIGNKELSRNLSAYGAIRVDARVVSVSGHTGTARLRLAFNLPDGTEWTTPTVALTDTYQTHTFHFDTLGLHSGSSPLDLLDAQPKFIVEKNGQTGSARFDFDEVVATTTNGSSGDYELTPVMLNPPPDGDAIRAIWLYAGTIFDTSAESQAVLDFCASEGINRIYCGAYSIWTLGSTQQQDHLRTFIETAHTSGIRVEALFGGTDWQADPAKVRTKIDQVLSMHTATPGNEQDDFDAVHFDVEFWLDDSWDAATTEAARQQIAIDYLDNVLVNARSHLNTHGESAMEISVDLSAHLENADKLPSAFEYDGTTQFFLEHVLDNTDDVVIMSYIDYAGGLLNWTGYELDAAAGKGHPIQLGADIQPVPPALPINSFADNSPTGFSSMTTTLEEFHTLLSSERLAALDGFSVFHYGGYSTEAPDPRNIADLDGDGDADVDDFQRFQPFLGGPGTSAEGLARDCDFNQDDAVDLADFAQFSSCYTGADVPGAIPGYCER